MRTSPESCPVPAAGTPLLTRPVAVPEGPSSLSLQPSSTAAKPRRRRGRAALPRGPYASAGPVARLSGGDGARGPLGATSPGVGGGVGYPRFGGGLFLPGSSRHPPPQSPRGVGLRQLGRPALRHAGGTRPGDRPRLLVALRGPTPSRRPPCARSGASTAPSWRRRWGRPSRWRTRRGCWIRNSGRWTASVCKRTRRMRASVRARAPRPGWRPSPKSTRPR
jgi:hypothetical protein